MSQDVFENWDWKGMPKMALGTQSISNYQFLVSNLKNDFPIEKTEFEYRERRKLDINAKNFKESYDLLINSSSRLRKI